MICDEALNSFIASVDPGAETVNDATDIGIAENSLERAHVRSRLLRWIYLPSSLKIAFQSFTRPSSAS
jgi:hypothetical protein